ncbi:Pycsar system effector family protein [Emcibacter nanhaiensis]|uniref:Pycsar effector protein domain-containing protein n=1 Tax=Emcibacter nanhaiensis TaxID=1505037 RepID=A0A501PHL7_9PROT|nr:Pycsar system effector family protein [Emcibacter nanhaiensis]TPD59336.1 hypothetical protein FIV46_11105 [Emcibacter nanhaiensis]
MNTETVLTLTEKISAAEKNLERQLNWISKYDTRLFFISGISFTMMGIAANAISDLVDRIDCLILLLAIVTFGLLTISTVCACNGFYPRTKAANNSLIYFGSIAHHDISSYMETFKNLTCEKYIDDLLIQIHVNSKLLDKKFRQMQVGFISLVVCVPFWILLIIISGNTF